MDHRTGGNDSESGRLLPAATYHTPAWLFDKLWSDERDDPKRPRLTDTMQSVRCVDCNREDTTFWTHKQCPSCGCLMIPENPEPLTWCVNCGVIATMPPQPSPCCDEPEIVTSGPSRQLQPQPDPACTVAAEASPIRVEDPGLPAEDLRRSPGSCEQPHQWFWINKESGLPSHWNDNWVGLRPVTQMGSSHSCLLQAFLPFAPFNPYWRSLVEPFDNSRPQDLKCEPRQLYELEAAHNYPLFLDDWKQHNAAFLYLRDAFELQGMYQLILHMDIPEMVKVVRYTSTGEYHFSPENAYRPWFWKEMIAQFDAESKAWIYGKLPQLNGGACKGLVGCSLVRTHIDDHKRMHHLCQSGRSECVIAYRQRFNGQRMKEWNLLLTRDDGALILLEPSHSTPEVLAWISGDALNRRGEQLAFTRSVKPQQTLRFDPSKTPRSSGPNAFGKEGKYAGCWLRHPETDGILTSGLHEMMSRPVRSSNSSDSTDDASSSSSLTMPPLLAARPSSCNPSPSSSRANPSWSSGRTPTLPPPDEELMRMKQRRLERLERDLDRTH